MWQIVNQPYKDGFVPIKWVRFYPIEKPDGEIVFGRLGQAVLRLIFKHHLHDDWQDWKVVYSKFGYNITCPKRQIRASKNPCDTSTVLVPGNAFGGKATSGSMTRRKLEQTLREQVGEEFTTTILNLFDEELA